MSNNKQFEKIIEKWPAKVLSVAAALLLFIFNRMNTLEARYFSAPLRIETSETLVPASSFTGVIRVGLRGEANSIFPILEEDIETYIDLGRYKDEGLYKIPVQIRRKGSALGIQPIEVSVDPIEISVRLERKTLRSVNVAPVFQGNIAEGYELTSQSISPAAVVAEGPRSVIDALYEFDTGTIDLSRRYEDFSIMVNIINNDPLIIIHGNRMIEYRGTIRRIPREPVYE